jgi:hypothetical protein
MMGFSVATSVGTWILRGCYRWAIAHSVRVSCIYARNPSLRRLMSKSAPIDNVAPLVKTGVPIIDCGGVDPWLNDQTRVVEGR